MMPAGRPWMLFVCGVAVTSPAAAQQPARPDPPAWRWMIGGSLGLARRQAYPWHTVHAALGPASWDAYFPYGRCVVYCPEAYDVVEGRPVGVNVAARKGVGGPWQVRALVGSAPLGTYPGANSGLQLSITPSVTLGGIQAVYAWRGIWLAAGPTVNRLRIVETAGPARRTAQATRAGLNVALGATFPRRSRMFIELGLERRITGRMSLPALAVAGASDSVPAMRLSLSHTVLLAGVGLRR